MAKSNVISLAKHRKLKARAKKQATKKPKAPRSLIDLRLLDLRDPVRPYLKALRAMQEHGGPWACRGFKKEAGYAGRWHRFSIETRRLAHFREDVDGVVASGRLLVVIDGRRIHTRHAA